MFTGMANEMVIFHSFYFKAHCFVISMLLLFYLNPWILSQSNFTKLKHFIRITNTVYPPF